MTYYDLTMTTKKIYELKYTDNTKSPIKVPRRVLISDLLDITLIGKRTLEYGEVLNQNLLHLLENFSCAAKLDDLNVPDPTEIAGKYLENPVVGQLWYNSTVKSLFVWLNGSWSVIKSFSDISGNSGFIYDGDIVPIPVDLHGYSHNVSDCVINVSPVLMEQNIESFTCEVSNLGVVTCKYTPVGGVERSGMASYMILCNKSVRLPLTPSSIRTDVETLLY